MNKSKKYAEECYKFGVLMAGYPGTLLWFSTPKVEFYGKTPKDLEREGRIAEVKVAFEKDYEKFIALKNGEAYIQVVGTPKGFKAGCKDCRQIISEGGFAVGVTIRDKDKLYYYFLGEKRTHCGKDKEIIEIFQKESSASVRCDEIISHFTEHQSNEGLILLSIIRPELN